MDEKSFSCAAGEHLVLGELLRKKYEVYLAHGKTQKGWDIVCLNYKNIKIQVKTINWPDKNAINGKFDSGFDILIIVLLNRTGNAKYFIIPSNKVEQFLSPKNLKRKDDNRTISFPKNITSEMKVFENNWSLITKKPFMSFKKRLEQKNQVSDT